MYIKCFSFRLVLIVQQQVEAEGGDDEREQWREFVADLWEERLPHHREEVYNDGAFVYDPHTGQYGFQDDSEHDSEGEGHTEDSFLVISEDQQQSLESSRREEGEGAGHPVEPKKEDESKPHCHILPVWLPLHLMLCTCSGASASERLRVPEASSLHGHDATQR